MNLASLDTSRQNLINESTSPITQELESVNIGTDNEIEIPELEEKTTGILKQVVVVLANSLIRMMIRCSSTYSLSISVSMNATDSTLTVTKEELPWFRSIFLLFALFTSMLIGALKIKYIGRKETIMAAAILNIISCVLTFRSIKWYLYAGRAFAGMSVGVASSALPAYLEETIHPEVQRSLGILPTVLENIGILVYLVVGIYVQRNTLALIGMIPAILFLALAFFIPGTPKSHIDNISDTNNNVFTDIFQNPNLKPLLIFFGLILFLQLGGIKAVIFYTGPIFQGAGIPIHENLCNIIVATVHCVFTLPISMLIDRFGKKVLPYISYICMIISLMIFGPFYCMKHLQYDLQQFEWLPLASFVIFVIGFSLGFGLIPRLIIKQILPSKVRTSATPIVTAFKWTCKFLVTKAFMNNSDAIGSDEAFWLFGSVCCVGMFLIVFSIIDEKQFSRTNMELTPL